MSETSAAIMCIARDEQPFAEEWLQYHLELGFDHIYFISTDDDFRAVQPFYSGLGFGSKVSLHHFDDFRRGWQARCYGFFSGQVQEDWLLVIDLDEFLYLHSNDDIKSYLDSLDGTVGQVQFPWLNLFSNRYSQDSTLGILDNAEAYASNHVKSLVRCKKLAGLHIHCHNTEKSDTVLSSGEKVKSSARHETFVRDPSYYARHPFILHFCSRGHLDLINRITGHKFFATKNGPVEHQRLRSFLTGRATWSSLPNRYLLMKVLNSFPQANTDITLQATGAKTDTTCLVDLFQNNVRRIVDFHCVDDEQAADSFEARYALDYKLESLQLGDIFDLEEFLKCSDQMQYIAILREQLQQGRF